MPCLSGFEPYSRWAPPSYGRRDLYVDLDELVYLFYQLNL